MSRPKKGEPGYAEYRERENRRQREGRALWASRGFGRRREWREAHREELNAYQRAGQSAHPGYSAAAQKRWREANPERAKELQREYRARVRIAAANEYVADILAAVKEATA